MKIIQKTTQAFLIALVAVASLGGAHVAQAQSSGMPAPSQCVSLGSNLGIGTIDLYGGGQVLALQTYLYQHGYMSHAPTGYYGVLTTSAVFKFQRANSILSTGYTGPLTRARLQALTCGTVQDTLSISTITPTSGLVGTSVSIMGSGFTSNSTVYFGGAVVGTTEISYGTANGCAQNNGTNSGCVGYSPAHITFTIPQYITPCPPNANCIQLAQQVIQGTYPVYVRNYDGSVSNTVNFTVTSSGSNQQFSVAGVDAPSTLPVNNTGTWTIRVNNNGGNLRYSVVWGDEYQIAYNAGIMAPAQNYQSSATFTHSYNRTGMFHPVFTVTDDSGRTATVSTSVTVTPIY